MAEPGCLHDAHFQNLEVSGDTTLGPITSNYLRFVTGEYFGMTVVNKTDAETDLGFILQANAITESLWDGGAAAAMVLPSATKDTICVFRFAASAAGVQIITFTTAAGDTYDAFSLQPPVIGGADLEANRGPRCLPSPTYNTTTNLVSASTANTVFSVAAAAAANNQTNIGAELVWYCRNDGEWLMAFVPSFIGTGARTTMSYT
jgi:hypothetical protein